MPTYFAIGDIHGRDALLALAHRDISARAQDIDGRKILVHLGDYIDRGPRSYQVIERIMQGLAGIETVNIRGNHEQMMLDFIRAPSPRTSKQWLSQGGWQTAASYGVHYSWWDRMRMNPKHKALCQAVPARHLEWFDSLPLIYRCEDDGFVFVHAGIDPSRELDEQRDEVLIWIRRPFLLSQKDYGFRVVHGHTPSLKLDVAFNRINLDAGLQRLRYMMSDCQTVQLFDVTPRGVQQVYRGEIAF